MSYRQLCSPRGLGYDFATMKAEASDYARESNAEVAQQAVDKLGVSAAYAGPILKAEQDSFDMLLQSGAQGKLPTPAQFASSLANLGVGVVSVAATGACGPLGPAAAICGMAAGYATQQIGNAIFGSGSKCGQTINGMCADQWWQQRNEAVLARCPPGSDLCRKRLQELWAKAAADQKKDQDAFYQWRSDCTIQQHTPYNFQTGMPGQTRFYPKNNAPDACWKNCGGWALSKEYADCMAAARKAGKIGYRFRNWDPVPALSMSRVQQLAVGVQAPVTYEPTSRLVAEETRILLESRYEAEYRFIQAVDQQTAALRTAYASRCKDKGCSRSVDGILGEGAYEAAVALRSSTGGPAIAQKILKNALSQAEGAIQTSSQLTKAQADIMSGQVASSADEQSTRRVILGVAAVAVLAAGVYAYTRKR